MKKILTILLFSILLIIPSKVYAFSGSPKIVCNNLKLSAGTQTKCSVEVDVTSGGIAGFSGVLESSDGLEISNIAVSSIWQGQTNGNLIGVYTGAAFQQDVTIATFDVKAKTNATGNQTITLKEINIVDESFNDVLPSNVTQNLSILSSNANLASLSVSSGTLSPSFNASTTSYNVTTTASSITINATSESSEASISGTGTKTLNYGANTFSVVVTSGSGTKKTYTITVTRTDTRSNDSKLKLLSLSSGTINFSSSTLNYNVTVPGSVNNVKVVAQANDSKAKVTYSPKDNIDLSIGKTSTITITVTAENGTKSVYKVNITRRDDRSSNNELKTLSVSNTNISFKNNTLSYTAYVEKDISSVTISATQQDNKATISGTGTKTLKEGSNTFYLTVTAENGAVKTYTITIIKKGNQVIELSSDANLKYLKISGLEIQLEENVYSYYINVSNETSELDIKYEARDSKAKTTMTGLLDLEVGVNNIDIVVTAEDGTSKTYNIKVERRPLRVEVENVEKNIIEKIEDPYNFDDIYVKVKTTDTNKTISEDLMNSIKESSKELIFEISDEVIPYYSFNVNKYKLGELESLNYEIIFESENIEKLNTKNYLPIVFTADKIIDAELVFKIYVSDKLEDLSEMYNLYHYDKVKEEYILVKENIDISEGFIELTTSDLSEYVLATLDEEEVPELIDKTVTPKVEEEKPKRNWWICLIIVPIVIAVLIVFFLKKKKKKKQNIEEPIVESSPVVQEAPVAEEPVVQEPAVTAETINNVQIETTAEAQTSTLNQNNQTNINQNNSAQVEDTEVLDFDDIINK